MPRCSMRSALYRVKRTRPAPASSRMRRRNRTSFRQGVCGQLDVLSSESVSAAECVEAVDAEGAQVHLRLPPLRDFGNQLCRDRREQDAVSIMAGREEEPVE